MGAPRWSPDGSLIVFDALVGGNRDIYAIAAGGGVLSRLTYGSSDEARPSWSADGQWVYFRSDRSGTQEIWKVRVSPKQEAGAVQVTHTGGFEAFESPDGKKVYYVKGLDRLGLWSIPAEGGAETLVHPWVRDGAWADRYCTEPAAWGAGTINLRFENSGDPLNGAAEVTGVVLDLTGAVIPRATIRLLESGGDQTHQTTSGEDGRFCLSALQAGFFEIQVFSSGFRTAMRRFSLGGRRLCDLFRGS